MCVISTVRDICGSHSRIGEESSVMGNGAD
jgi:hypothetical protein